MENITLFNQSIPQIGYVSRTCTQGEEFDMVNFYIEAIVQKYSKLKKNVLPFLLNHRLILDTLTL